MYKEYKTIKELVGPLMLVEGVEGVKYNELVEIETSEGLRRGKVLEVNRDRAVVQLFENSQGLQISTSKARLLGHSIELSVSEDMVLWRKAAGYRAGRLCSTRPAGHDQVGESPLHAQGDIQERRDHGGLLAIQR